MKSLYNRSISIFLAVLMFSNQVVQAAPDDLKGAFSALKASMGEVAQPESNADLDRALEEAFDPVPTQLHNSSVPVEEVDGPQADVALKQVATIPVNDNFEIEYEQYGFGLSLTLWRGSGRAIKTLFTNIIRQLYSDNDSKNIRLVLNSDPMPSIRAYKVDFNDSLRAHEQTIAQRKWDNMLSGLTSEEREKRSKFAPKVNVPERPGIAVEISAGEFATYKNVDEMAGQIAKVLSQINPTVYGVREDTRFTRNQQILEMINQIVDETNKEGQKREVALKRDQVIAEFSAMERLAQAGFNPWALYYYEERELSWISDVFMKSSMHSLGRYLVDTGSVRLDDWSRPIRLQLQEHYMHYLQSIERGKGMRLDDTEFSSRMKFIRLRMKLFTKPFFSGLAWQIGTVVLAGGATVSHFFFPQAAHMALQALHVTSADLPGELHKAGVTESPGILAGLLQKGHEVTNQILDTSFLGYNARDLGEAGKTALSFFYDHYDKLLIAGGVIIVSALVARYANVIKTIFVSASKTMEDGRALESQDQIKAEKEKDNKILADLGASGINGPNLNVSKDANADEQNLNDLEKQAEEVELVMGATHTKTKWAREAGARVTRFFQNLPEASATFIGNRKQQAQNAAEKVGVILKGRAEATKEAAQKTWTWTIKKSGDGMNASREAAIRFANNGKRLAQATGSASVRAWEFFGNTAKATPAATAKAAVGTYKAVVTISNAAGRGSVQVAKFTGRVTKNGAIAIGTGVAVGSTVLAKGTVSLVGAVLIEAPKGFALGTVDFARKTALAYSDYKIKRAEAKVAKAEKKRIENEAQAAFEQRMAEGSARFQELLADPNATFERINLAIDAVRRALFESKPSAHDKEVWGLQPSKELPKPRDAAIMLVEKWLNLAQVRQPSEDALVTFLHSFSNLYASMKWEDRMKPRTVAAMARAWELFKNSSIEHIKGWISASKTSHDQEGMLLLKDMMTHERTEISKRTKSGEAIADALANSGALAYTTFKQVYAKNEDSIARWLGSPESKPEDYQQVLFSLSRVMKGDSEQSSRKRFEKAVYSLSAIERAKIALYSQMPSPNGNGFNDVIFYATNEKAKKFLSESVSHTAHIWVNNAKTMRELNQKITADTNLYKLNPLSFRNDLKTLVAGRPDLIKNYEDATIYFQNEFYWPNETAQINGTPLERPLIALLQAKRNQFGNSPAWKYDPITSERIQRQVKESLIRANQFPKDFSGLKKTWELFTSRGVSTVTDDMLATLFKLGTTEQINELEKYAVDEGRVFDQNLRDEFALRQIKRSHEYQALMAVKKSVGQDRRNEITGVIHVAQTTMKELGIKYIDFLEDLSNEIQSTYAEAEIIHEAKAKRLVQAMRGASQEANDTRVQMLHDILPYVKEWSPKNQYDFLLYLRGSIEATEFIQSQFPTFGPERIRKIYQGLPLESAMAVVNMYLKGTLLARKEVNEGYGKKLIEYLVSHGANEETKEYAALLLQGLLYGIEKAKNKPFQIHVLSALIAMKPNENQSVGETLKLILEQFPGVGPKIGQFLVGTGLLPEDINKVLIKTQDETLPPKRFDIYSDLGMIVGRGKNLGINLEQLLGGGSLKYSVKGTELTTNTSLVLQVFREDVQNSADLQIKVLNGMIEYLVKKGGKKWAFLQVVVDGAMNAVAREKRFTRESTKTLLAQKRIYKDLSDERFTISVPEQDFINKRLLTARYAKGGSFFKLSQADKQIVGLKILEMEANILFSNSRESIWYDTDRHAGNYLIDVVNRDGQRHYMIYPIDFGQLTYIRREQRQKVVELFSLAALLGKMGSNDWIAEKVASQFDIKGSELKALKENLGELFPVSAKANSESVVTHYFRLIAGINESVKGANTKNLSRDLETGKLDFAYTDFVRAIIQLNQYESAIKLPETAKTPRKMLEAQVKDRLAEHLQEVVLNRKQSLGVQKINLENWLKSKVKGSEFTPIEIRMTREDLEKIDFMANAKMKPTGDADPAVEVTGHDDKSGNQGHEERSCRSLLQGGK